MNLDVEPFEDPFPDACRSRAIALMEGRFGKDALMPLAALSLPVMSSQGVVLYRVERWNTTSGHYVAWRVRDDGTLRINEFPPGSHELLRADPTPKARPLPRFEDFAPPDVTRMVPRSDADDTFLRALGFDAEELPNVERLAPYVEAEARRLADG